MKANPPLIKRYRCRPACVELVLMGTDDRPLRRRTNVEQRILARLRDVSLIDVHVELLVKPRVPPNAKLQLVWSGSIAEVRIAQSRVHSAAGFVVLMLTFQNPSAAFRQTIDGAILGARQAHRDRAHTGALTLR